MYPLMCLRRISRQMRILHESARRIIRKEGLCLYMVHRVQEPRRMDYVPTYWSPIIPSQDDKNVVDGISVISHGIGRSNN